MKEPLDFDAKSVNSLSEALRQANVRENDDSDKLIIALAS
jgi:hypothetical protein